MEVTFAPRGIVQIDGARICFRNFKGEASMYNANGERTFSLIIPDEEVAEALRNDKNEMGAGWNVKIKAPREEGEEPFMHLPIKVKYTERSKPRVYLQSGKNRVELTEETIGLLDDISISSVDLDIRPYDSESRFGAHRTAYLQSMLVTQNMDFDRFAARFAEEEYPED
jgi:hypothetical protein